VQTRRGTKTRRRPPIAEERLTWTEDGRLRYELKRAWKDGTCAVILSPLDLCARVCALIPRPGFHMVRYYGCLSSHASLRREVVPEPPLQWPIRSPPIRTSWRCSSRVVRGSASSELKRARAANGLGRGCCALPTGARVTQSRGNANARRRRSSFDSGSDRRAGSGLAG
jgi:hypothetical protein